MYEGRKVLLVMGLETSCRKLSQTRICSMITFCRLLLKTLVPRQLVGVEVEARFRAYLSCD
jgi:hypothetical protein